MTTKLGQEMEPLGEFDRATQYKIRTSEKEENEKRALAANQCLHDAIVGDEGGTPYCSVKRRLDDLLEAVRPFCALVSETSGRIPVERLSFADWHKLVKASNAVVSGRRDAEGGTKEGG